MPRKLPASLDLERFVPFYINMISNRLSYDGSKLYSRRFGITLMEWRIVSFLRTRTNVSATDICRTLALDKAAVSRAIGELETKRFLNVRPIDKRQSALTLTEKGRSLHDRVLPFAFERQRVLLAPLTKSEIGELERLLRLLHGQLPAVAAIDEGSS